MGNQEEIGSWILNHLHSHGLLIERMGWIKDWFPEYTDFRITATIEGEVLVGRGIDQDQDTALYKAFSELVERSYCAFHKIDSNGVAAHFDKSQAELNAKKELIERDAILCHHLTGKPFFLNEYPKRLDALKERLREFGFELKFAEAISPVEDYRVTVCQILGGQKFGSIWGFGCDTDFNKAFDHALFEAMINVSAYIHGNYTREVISIEEFDKLSLARGLDHQRLHFSKFVSPLDFVSVPLVFSPVMGINEIQTSELDGRGTPFASVPLYVVQAHSDQLQGIFYGSSSFEKINSERLQHFLGRGLTQKEISGIPHPIG